LSAATLLWDLDGWRQLCTLQVHALRKMGGLTMLPWALSTLAGAEMYAGDLASAASLVAESESVVEVTGIRFAPYSAARLAGWRGRLDEAEPIIAAVITTARAQGQGMAVKLAQSAHATLYNSLGRYDLALAAAEEAHRDPPSWSAHLTLPELVEAAVRSDERAAAERAFDRLETSTRPSGTDWALGIEARSRALLTEGETAEACYVEAIERLDRSSVRAEAARAHLLYGEWLRRENRRVDARAELVVAHQAFLAMGAEGFAERAARELGATGATVRKRSADSRYELTAQESQIARLAADGHTNPEIGALLFLSARTVEWHLGKVYPKLGITSRRGLRAALDAQPIA
jgi:ATP/maltotriose-dependent transcriptional regulator MalT